MSKHIESERLQAYLDREIGIAERDSIEAHLAQCQSCAHELSRVQQLFQRIESIPVYSLERDLTPAVLQSIRPESFLPARVSILSALQGIGGLLLLGVLWPVISDSLTRLSAQAAAWDLGVWLQGILARIQPELLQAADQARVWMNSFTVGLEIDVAVLPLSFWWMVLAGAFIFWIFGNGLLLTRWARRSNGL